MVVVLWCVSTPPLRILQMRVEFFQISQRILPEMQLNSKYRLLHQIRDKSKVKNFIIEKFKKQFHFSTCISPDYVSHETSKEF